MKPVVPSSMCSVVPPPSAKTIVGTPSAIASTAALPNDSRPLEGRQNASMPWTRFATSVCRPANRVRDRTPEPIDELLQATPLGPVADDQQPQLGTVDGGERVDEAIDALPILQRRCRAEHEAVRGQAQLRPDVGGRARRLEQIELDPVVGHVEARAGNAEQLAGRQRAVPTVARQAVEATLQDRSDHEVARPLAQRIARREPAALREDTDVVLATQAREHEHRLGAMEVDEIEGAHQLGDVTDLRERATAGQIRRERRAAERRHAVPIGPAAAPEQHARTHRAIAQLFANEQVHGALQAADVAAPHAVQHAQPAIGIGARRRMRRALGCGRATHGVECSGAKRGARQNDP